MYLWASAASCLRPRSSSEDPTWPAMKCIGDALEAEVACPASHAQVGSGGDRLWTHEVAVDLAGHITLQAPDDLPQALALSPATLDIGLGRRVTDTEPHHHDPPQGVVGLGVA